MVAFCLRDRTPLQDGHPSLQRPDALTGTVEQGFWSSLACLPCLLRTLAWFLAKSLLQHVLRTGRLSLSVSTRLPSGP